MRTLGFIEGDENIFSQKIYICMINILGYMSTLL